MKCSGRSIAVTISCTGAEIWSEKLSLVSPDERRKLCALALSQLCSSPWAPVLRVWSSAITSVAEVIFDRQ